MYSSHNVHISNQLVKCSIEVALQECRKQFSIKGHAKELYAKKLSNFLFCSHNVLINVSKLLAERRRNVALDQSFSYRYHSPC